MNRSREIENTYWPEGKVYTDETGTISEPEYTDEMTITNPIFHAGENLHRRFNDTQHVYLHV